jgi:hypothetical protein
VCFLLCIRDVLVSFVSDAGKDELSGGERQCFLKCEASNGTLSLFKVMVGEHHRQVNVFLEWK